MTVHLWSGVYGTLSPRRYFQLSEKVLMNWVEITKVLESYPNTEGLTYGDEHTTSWMLSLPGGLV